ncbi:MAG: DegT/DnrJ/EryC1/StrS aminotransferase family protein [Deltaproteobacteria bacterium]|nr:DegT/DnrJ/EryC1/StrS aminotransferase family protein [Deltaproteobacteria bacterium]
MTLRAPSRWIGTFGVLGDALRAFDAEQDRTVLWIGDLDQAVAGPSDAELDAALAACPAETTLAFVVLACGGHDVAARRAADAPWPLPPRGPARQRLLHQARVADRLGATGRRHIVARVFDPCDPSGGGPGWLVGDPTPLEAADTDGLGEQSQVTPVDAADAATQLVEALAMATVEGEILDVGGPAVTTVEAMRQQAGLPSWRPGGWHRVAARADVDADAGWPADAAIPYVRPHVPPSPRLLQRWADAARSGKMTNGGPQVLALEAELGDPARILATSSGSTALAAILRLAPAGRPVVLPAFTFAATANMAHAAGYDVVLCDVEPERWVVDARCIRDALERCPEAGAVLAVNAFGEAPDFPEIAALCAERGVVLLYDNAHGVGHHHPLPDGVAAAAHSLHATKVLPAAEGGFASFAAIEDCSRAAWWRNHGVGAPDGRIRPGSNAKMSELHAALARESLEDLPALLARRRTDEAYLRAIVAALPGAPLILQRRRDPDLHNAQNLVVRVDADAGRFAAALAAHGVAARRYFHPSLRTLAHLGPQPPTPVADALAAQVLALPLWPRMPTAVRDRIAAALRAAAAQVGST